MNGKELGESINFPEEDDFCGPHNCFAARIIIAFGTNFSLDRIGYTIAFAIAYLLCGPQMCRILRQSLRLSSPHYAVVIGSYNHLCGGFVIA